jgi:hypothetical protein
MCHTTGNYAEVSADCVSCHQTDYNGTTNPNHQTVGFSTDCISCHTTAPGWTPAEIGHDFFPLTQGHNIADCTQCHTTGNYLDASADCISCHQADYNQTSDPNHLAANFPEDCATCHTLRPGWTPVSWDHDALYFPIRNGTHKVATCTDCHTNLNDYSEFSCLTCHDHEQTQTDADHSEVNGYAYESFACLSCHPG